MTCLMVPNLRRGFTLIELSIVLIIVSLVTGMAISSGIAVVSTARLNATQQKMSAIDDALMTYRIANDRLPCPGNLAISSTSTDYGIEAGADSTSTTGVGTGVCAVSGMLPFATYTFTNTNTTYMNAVYGNTVVSGFNAGGTNPSTGTVNGNNVTVTGYEGSLPAITLGLPADFMVDGWGNQFRYAVDATMTKYRAFSGMPIGCVYGAVHINDANNNARSSGAVYALISQGANGHGAYTKNGVVAYTGSTNTNEGYNCHCNATALTWTPNTATSFTTNSTINYVQMAPYIDTALATDNFDDLVSYKERWQMQTAWDTPGSCQYAYIADAGNNVVRKFDMQGNYIGAIGSTAGSGNGQFSSPFGITQDSNGNFWVSDSTNSRVQKFDSSWNWLGSLGTTSSSSCSSCLCTSSSGCTMTSGSTYNGQFSTPGGVAVDKNNNLWVADWGSPRVQEFDTNGNYLNVISSGTLFPLNTYGVMIDRAGDIWVGTASGNSPWYMCTSASASSCTAVGSGNFTTTRLGAVDAFGNVWLTNQTSVPNPIQEYNYNPASATPTVPTRLNSYGGSGSGKGNFTYAFGMAFDLMGNLWITDKTTNKFQIMPPGGTFAANPYGCNSSGIYTCSAFSNPRAIVISSR